MPRLLFIVDDDSLSREIFSLLAAEAGFVPHAFASGEAVLAQLAVEPLLQPSALLIDMQMNGLSGDPLAQRLRAACTPATLLIAMSGSAVGPAQRLHFDTFLLKPFTFAALLAALADAPASIEPDRTHPSTDVLSQATYQILAESMSAAQVGDLYAMLLTDAERRLQSMRQALAVGDGDTYRRAAHAIKGGCGMVGALELASLAADMEEQGLPAGEMVDQVDPFTQFQAAIGRLRFILATQPQF